MMMLPVSFHEWKFQSGGKEYRAIHTERYTYARNLKGPWLLYDNKQESYQQHNLIDHSEYADL